MPSPLSVLTRNRDFRYLFAAQLVVFGADWFVMVPLLELLPTLTGSGVWGGLVIAIDTGITALLLPYAGTIADRVDRKRLMIYANVITVVGIVLLLAVRSAHGAWLALAAIGVVAVAKAFYSPAAQAALPNVVDPAELSAANAVAGSAWGTMTVVGASLGGVLSSVLGPYTCFALAAGALVGSALVAWRIRRPLQAHGAAPVVAARSAVREAFVYIRSNPRVRALVTVKSAVGLGNGVLTVFPLLAGMFGAGAIGTGLLFAVRGAGSMVGPLLMRAVLTRRSWLLPGMALSMATYGLSYLGASVTTVFPLLLALVFLAHLAGGGNWAMSNFALQGEVPDRLRGRVFATDMMVATLAISASQLVVAAVVDHVSEQAVLAGCGLVTFVYAVVWWLATRRLARVDTPEPVRE